MATRICDLRLKLNTSALHKRIQAFYAELAARDLRFKPPCYFADEWFVPEGDPVIGVPFYLANKNLQQLEKKLIGEVEGNSHAHFMKLLRHEAGHAFSYAYKLYRKPSYKKIFGPSSKMFLDFYKFNRKSKKFVIHLEDHYAQSHPDEDFAETFAVWLTHSQKIWEKKYKGWRALYKLRYIDQQMNTIKNKKPLVSQGEKMCQVSTLKYTLWTYYMRRRSFLAHHGKLKV